MMRSFRVSNGRELTSALYFIATISYGASITRPIGQVPQNSEQAICNRYGLEWTCKLITDCRWSSSVLHTPLEQSCGSDGGAEKICCPGKNSSKSSATTSATRTRLSSTTQKSSPSQKDYAQIIRRKCVEYAQARYVESCAGDELFGQQKVCEPKLDCIDSTEPLIVNGKDAAPKEFPHMALVGSGQNLNSIRWVCGGSLISERFILSAAHCTNEGSPNEQIRWAAIGILLRGEAENGKGKVFQIVKAYNHPGYKKSRANYDIAVYKLKDPVKFSPLVRPICLHTEPNIPQDNKTRGIITGWGVSGTGFDVVEVLQKASINFLANNLCTDKYVTDRNLDKGFEAKSMVCAGDLDHDVDTCSGDSGGPIQIKQKEECMYAQVGITSIGDSWCANRTPAIYTRVFAYLDWIGEIVWPNEV